MNRLELIRQKEREYHDDCYENIKLFEEGSWLHKPVRTVLDLFDTLENKEAAKVLDLGCGIGRNSIPLAERMKLGKGKVVCVDLLDSAITHLHKYAEEHGVSDRIESSLSDIASFPIKSDYYDLVFSVSSLEHLDSKETFDRVLADIRNGTRSGGVNGFIISTNITETVIDTGERLDPMFELLFETEELISKLQGFYKDWKLLKHAVKPYAVEIDRDGHKIQLYGDVVTWAVQK